jgi:predicted phage gp36 major capsid-like protein
MKRACASLKRAIASATVVATAAIAGLPASAQTTSPSPSTSMTIKTPRTTATPEMIEEAIERSKARTERFKATGIPEEFGSEEPFRLKRSK